MQNINSLRAFLSQIRIFLNSKLEKQNQKNNSNSTNLNSSLKHIKTENCIYWASTVLDGTRFQITNQIFIRQTRFWFGKPDYYLIFQKLKKIFFGSPNQNLVHLPIKFLFEVLKFGRGEGPFSSILVTTSRIQKNWGGGV